MARPLRIEYEGALYHVMSRGNERRAIVRDDSDRAKRLHWYKETVSIYDWRVHAFCLMTNHALCGAPHKSCNVKFGIMWSKAVFASNLG